MPSPVDSTNFESVKYLQSLKSIRDRCEQVYSAVQAGHPESRFEVVDEADLDSAADYVAAIIKRDYSDPSRDIPPHSRWRHFLPSSSIDTEIIEKGTGGKEEITKSLLDLFVVSVLLDAGAGDRWKYNRAGYPGGSVGRSEGLAMASMDMFTSGAFSLNVAMRHRVDADALIDLKLETLSDGLQVNEDSNPLIGLQGRLDLLKRLGSVLKDPKNQEFFFNSKDSSYRPGNLLNFLLRNSRDSRTAGGLVVDIEMLWKVVIDGFGGVWPEEGRIKMDGVCLGDVWPSKILSGSANDPNNDYTKTRTPSSHLVTFHKLSQWLTYSLIEPLEQLMRIKFQNKSQLTGLAEYRNGGLFVDLGVLKVKSEFMKPEYQPADEVIIQWRALTICLLDRLAPRLRLRLGVDEEAFSLPKMLEGGTWKAGRIIARERRPETAGPPIKMVSDGTLF